jgi:hypothetical protein
MRAFGFALLTASIALSSGGVAYRQTAQAQVAAESAADGEICRTQPVQEAVRSARISASAPADSVISLNARGFNYSRPGDPVPMQVRLSGEAPAAPRD